MPDISSQPGPPGDADPPIDPAAAAPAPEETEAALPRSGVASSRQRRVDSVLTGDPRRLLIRLGLPITLSFVSATVFTMIDRWFVAQLPDSQPALAGIGLAFAIEMCLIAVGAGMSAGTASAVARRLGAGRWEAAAQAGAQAVWLVIILSLLAALLSPLAATILAPAAATPEVLGHAAEFAGTILLGAIGWFGTMILGGIFRGAGDTVTPMVTNIIGVLVNLALDPILIFGLGPIPAFGVQGAAMATVVGRTVSGVILLAILISRRNPVGRGVFRPRIVGDAMRDVLKVGVPISVGMIFGAGYLYTLNWIAGDAFGEVAQAAIQLGFLFEQFAFLPVHGLGIALTTIVGQNFGAGLRARQISAVKWCVVYAGGMITIVAAVYAVLAPQLVSVYAGDDPELARTATDYLRIAAIGLPAYGVATAIGGAFSGRGKGAPGLILQIMRMYIFAIPLLLILRPFGLPAFWFALPTGGILATAVGALWIRAEFRRDDAPTPQAKPQ
jgi:putative MATE family efflux protein